MTSRDGIEIMEGQRWECDGGFEVEVVCVRKAPAGSVLDDVVGGYIASSHRFVTLEADDFVLLKGSPWQVVGT